MLKFNYRLYTKGDFQKTCKNRYPPGSAIGVSNSYNRPCTLFRLASASPFTFNYRHGHTLLLTHVPVGATELDSPTIPTIPLIHFHQHAHISGQFESLKSV